MTTGTSELNEERSIDVTVGTVKRLLLMAYNNYQQAWKDEAKAAMSYWDGYIRGLQHVLEQEKE